ncbi:GH12 family glycosyl hydrolase domain-containing protein [Saccharolobus islandicus]|uniref:Endoglucanase n=2 Tax=Saccharolobus islandicus TaxID=43080 RepID=F0NH73_SACI5|nr:endoglucanase [Sulfolobus islandicus]ADX84872.1 endoglucanase precursor [Sulfolobus islandicus REY15A]WCM36884.1 endoglucanase [Sulfolobus islandicus]
MIMNKLYIIIVPIIVIIVVGAIGGAIYLHHQSPNVKTLSITVTTNETTTLMSITTNTVPTTVTPTTSSIPQLIYVTSSASSPTPVYLNNSTVPLFYLEVNMWNAKTWNGNYTMVFNPLTRTLSVSFNLTQVNPLQWTNGYPEIYVGRKPWDTSYAGNIFPMRIGNMTPFMVSFYINLTKLDPSINFDIASDAWIVRPQIAFSPGTAPGNGDIEIMVWLFSQNLQPAGQQVGELVIPIYINHTLVNATFQVWEMKSVPWGGWEYIAFRPDGWKVTNGYVAYEPNLFIKALNNFTSYNITNYYLTDWEFGTEWGTMTSNGTAYFSWTISNFSETLL